MQPPWLRILAPLLPNTLPLFCSPSRAFLTLSFFFPSPSSERALDRDHQKTTNCLTPTAYRWRKPTRIGVRGVGGGEGVEEWGCVPETRQDPELSVSKTHYTCCNGSVLFSVHPFNSINKYLLNTVNSRSRLWSTMTVNNKNSKYMFPTFMGFSVSWKRH